MAISHFLMYQDVHNVNLTLSNRLQDVSNGNLTFSYKDFKMLSMAISHFSTISYFPRCENFIVTNDFKMSIFKLNNLRQAKSNGLDKFSR